jgi:hypothetical protein
MLAILLLFRIAHAQSAPTLTTRWEGYQALRVDWSGASGGSCLYLDGAFLPVPCGASGSALLTRHGVDTAYRPDPGDTLSLMRDETREVLASAVVPPFVVILPVVVALERQEIR